MSNDEQFEHKVKASLDASVDALDTGTRKRLADIRNIALNRQAQNAKTHTFTWPTFNTWLPASALALCSLFAVFLVFSPQTKDALPQQNDQVAVFELLNNADELDAMTDPDFYAWIDESLGENLDKDVDVAS